jgi:hypothetical protein
MDGASSLRSEPLATLPAWRDLEHVLLPRHLFFRRSYPARHTEAVAPHGSDVRRLTIGSIAGRLRGVLVELTATASD